MIEIDSKITPLELIQAIGLKSYEFLKDISGSDFIIAGKAGYLLLGLLPPEHLTGVICIRSMDAWGQFNVPDKYSVGFSRGSAKSLQGLSGVRSGIYRYPEGYHGITESTPVAQRVTSRKRYNYVIVNTMLGLYLVLRRLYNNYEGDK